MTALVPYPLGESVQKLPIGETLYVKTKQGDYVSGEIRELTPQSVILWQPDREALIVVMISEISMVSNKGLSL